jgi:Multiubiquitin
MGLDVCAIVDNAMSNMAVSSGQINAHGRVKEVDVEESRSNGGHASADADGRTEADVVVITKEIVVENGGIVEEIIDVEEYIKSGRTPHPRARGYRVRVDKQKFVFDKAHVTGREILEKAGKTPPDKYILRQVLKGGVLEKVELDQVVDLARHGIEKFKTMLKTAQDGRS